eukprot:6067380-Amphidinium_carterae.1
MPPTKSGALLPDKMMGPAQRKIRPAKLRAPWLQEVFSQAVQERANLLTFGRLGSTTTATHSMPHKLPTKVETCAQPANLSAM